MDEIENDKLERYENYLSIPYGFQSITDYSHGSKRCNIQAITYNSKTNEYIILDSRGISSWLKTFNQNSIKRILQFESYKFNVLRDIQYCRYYNIYFGLTKEYQLKIYNLNFHETFSIESDGASILSLIYNTQTNELITTGRSKLQFWKITSLNRDQSSQELVLDREYNITNSALINNTYLDERLQRIYVIANYDISCYNIQDGRFVFNIKNASSSVLTVCAFSHLANVLVVGAVSGEISIFSSTGGNVATLVNHTKLITAIIMHPSDNNLFISSSLDGCIKLFSLQTLGEVFSFNIFSEGVYWMKVHSLKYLYAASTKHVKILDLNYSFKFWSTLRSQIKNISINPAFLRKSSHAFIQATDHSIRIYQAKNGHKKCTVLPPPELNILNEIIWVTYDRIGSVVYTLFDDANVWVYITKTDPATRVATWNVGKALQEKPENEENKFGKSILSQRLEDQQVRCLCLCTIARSALKNVPEVPENMLNFSLLMCGLSNGTLVLLDPITNGSVHDSFKAHHNSPVLSIKIAQANEYTHIYTLLCTVEKKFMRVFDVIHDFIILCDVFISPNTEAYIYKNLIVVTGDSAGNLQVGKIQRTCGNQVKYLTENIEYKEHQGAITGLDVHCVKDIICSSADDNFIRVWNLEKILLIEIELEHSLASVAFLDKSLAILFGFKSHLFIIPDYILRLLKKKLCSSDDETTDENSEIESVVYEDIMIRKEMNRSAYHKAVETNLSNYLVPYPYLGLEKLWLYTDTINKHFYDKEESTKSEENEDEIYAISDDSFSCADSNLYQESLSITSSVESICEFPTCITSPEPDYIKSGKMNDVIENEPFVKASGINIFEKEKKTNVSSKVSCVPVEENESELANPAQQPEPRKINLFEINEETPSQLKDSKSTTSSKRFVERKIVKKVRKIRQNFSVKKREKESIPPSTGKEISNGENHSSKEEKNDVNIVKEWKARGKTSTDKLARIQEKEKYKKDNFETQPSKLKKAEPKYQNSSAQSSIRNTSKQQNLNEKKSILKTKVSKATNHSNLERPDQDHKQKKTALVQLATGQFDRTISNSVRDVMSSLTREKSNQPTSETKPFKDRQSPTTAADINVDTNNETHQREFEQGQEQTDINGEPKVDSVANEIESINSEEKSGQFSQESHGYVNAIKKEIENDTGNRCSPDRPKLLRRSYSEIISKAKDDSGHKSNIETYPNQTLNRKLRCKSVRFPNSLDLSVMSTPLRKSATADLQIKPESNSKEQQFNTLMKKNRAEIIALRSLIRRNSISQSQVEGGSTSRFIDVCISKVGDINNDQSRKEHPNKHKSEGLVRIAKKHSNELSDPTILDISDDESCTQNTDNAQIPSLQIIRQEKNDNDIKTAKELKFPDNHFHSDFSVQSHVMSFIVSAFKKPSPVSTPPPEAQSSSPINTKKEILPSEVCNSQAENLETVETTSNISKIEIHKKIDEITTQVKASKLQQGSASAVKAVSNIRKSSSRRNWKAMTQTSVKGKFSDEFDVFITPRNSFSSIEYMPVSRVDIENSRSPSEEEETVQEDRHEKLKRLIERNPVLYDKLVKHKRKLLKKKITACEKQRRASKAISKLPNEIPVKNDLNQRNHDCRHVNSRNSERISSSPILNQISNSRFAIRNHTSITSSPMHLSSSGSSGYISAMSNNSHENDLDLAPRKINYTYEDQRMKNLQRIDNLEKKLSGQKHRFHVQKSIDDIRNENFELHFLRNKVHGTNLLLPIEKLDVSTPPKSCNSYRGQIRVVSPSKSKRETFRAKVK